MASNIRQQELQDGQTSVQDARLVEAKTRAVGTVQKLVGRSRILLAGSLDVLRWEEGMTECGV